MSIYGTTGPTDNKNEPEETKYEYQDPDSNKKKNTQQQQSSSEPSKNDTFMKKLIVFSKFVVPFFILIAIACLLLTVLGALSILNLMATVFEILLCALIGAMAGAYGVYKFGTMQDQLDRLNNENNKYESELSVLKSTSGRLKTEVNEVQTSIHGLQKSVDDLQEQIKQFDHLKTELESIAGDSKEIHNLLNTTNTLFDEMSRVAIQNEKAHLLSIYYECQFRDDEQGMSKGEYQRFLGRLPKLQREKFEKLGTFEELAGNDGLMDLDEFQRAISKFLEEVEEELIQHRVNEA